MPDPTNATDGPEKPTLDDDGHLAFSPDDPENPKNYSFRRKTVITLVSISLVINAAFASSAPSGAIEDISSELHVSTEAAGLVITLFLLGYVAGPLFWAPWSEFYGRRWIFYISFTLYVAGGFLCAFTPNFAGLLVGRFWCGTAVSAALTNAPGIFADIWGPEARRNAMIAFAAMTFAGPALGPVVGGFLQLKKDWRWVFYVLLMMAGGTLLLLPLIPETLPAIVLRSKARRLRKTPGNEDVKAPVEVSDRSLGGMFKVALTRPWKIMFDPISFFVDIYLAVVYMLLYMLFSIYPIVFQEKRGYNAGVGELPLIGIVVGAAIGAPALVISGRRQQKASETRKLSPEDRLPIGMFGGVLFPVSIFWFAWTAQYASVHWAVPTVAGVFLAMSIEFIFVVILNYIMDVYQEFAASALAANTVLRSACAAAAPLFTTYMFDKLGVGGAGSLLGGVAVILMFIPFVFYKYGAAIRARSKYATTDECETSQAPSDEEKASD